MRKKLVFGITSLTMGGAERVLVDIANELCYKYDVTIFTIYSKGEFEKELSNNVKLISIYDCKYEELKPLQRQLIPLKLLFFKKKTYSKYIKDKFDVEISFLEGAITRIFSVRKGKNAKKIAWIHNDIGLVFGNGIKAKIKTYIDRKIYDKYDKIIFVSNDNKKKFNSIYSKIESEKTEVLYNYIDKNKIIEKSNEKPKINFDNNVVNFVTVCRLVEQKALGRLINVCERLKENATNFRIYVVGDGPLKEELLKKIKEKNLEKHFKLIGKMENPYPYIRNADVFCLLSYFEGYGMVVEEAKILNKRILITNTAAREVLKDYSNSEIIDNNEEAIYNAILKEINKNGFKYEKENKNYDNKYLIEKIENIIDN